MTILIAAAAVFVVALGFVVLFGAPYVPSKRSDLRTAFDELYKLNKRDVLVDIGCGDGIVLREASRRGARAIGFEINPLLVGIAKYLSRHDKRVVVKLANAWKVPFPRETSVVYVFGESRDIKKIQRTIQAQANLLQKELYVVSYGFEFPGITALRKHRAHILYKISPLQAE